MAHGHVLRVVDRTDPQAQHVGTELVTDLDGIDDVANGLRHLAAVLVDRETAAQDRLVGGIAIRTDTREQRGLEPTTMLVGALEVEVCRTMQVRTRAQHARVRDAGLPPHVEHVLLTFELMTAAVGAAHA